MHLIQEENQENQENNEYKRMELQNSIAFKLLEGVAQIMDDYFLDPIIGFIPVIGDTVTLLNGMPAIYIALCKIKSIPLTLAILANLLKDALIGMTPFWIGNILDFFLRSNRRNYKLIMGFVNGDIEVIKEVNRNALWMALFILLLGFLIYWMIQLIAWIGTWGINLLDKLIHAI